MAPDSPSTFSRRRVLALSSAVSGTALAGCAGLRTRLKETYLGTPDRQVPADWRPAPGEWPTADYDLARTRHNPHATPPREGPERAWTADVATSGWGSLVVADDTVFVRGDTDLVALDTGDGSERWRKSRPERGDLKFVAGRVYDMERERLRAVTPAGEEVWTTEFEQSVPYDVLERDGWVYALRYYGGGHRLHADTGDVVAEVDAEVSIPTTSGGTVYSGRFSLSAHDIVDGEFVERWSGDAPNPYEAYSFAAGSGDRLFRGEQAEPGRDAKHPGRLAVYDAATGSQKTAFPLDHAARAPAVDDDSVYVSTSTVSAGDIGNGGQFVALTRAGEERWRYEPGHSLQPPLVAGGAVYVGPFASEGPLLAFDTTTGEELWREAGPGTPDDELSGAPEFAAAGDTLYVGTGDGLVAYRA